MSYSWETCSYKSRETVGDVVRIQIPQASRGKHCRRFNAHFGMPSWMVCPTSSHTPYCLPVAFHLTAHLATYFDNIGDHPYFSAFCNGALQTCIAKVLRLGMQRCETIVLLVWDDQALLTHIDHGVSLLQTTPDMPPFTAICLNIMGSA